MRKSLGREAGAVLSLKSGVGALLGTRANPAHGRSFSFFRGARSDSSGLSLSLLFRSPLLASPSLSPLALRGSLSPPRLLYLVPSVMHFLAALFTCFRPSRSVLESPARALARTLILHSARKGSLPRDSLRSSPIRWAASGVTSQVMELRWILLFPSDAFLWRWTLRRAVKSPVPARDESVTSFPRNR